MKDLLYHLPALILYAAVGLALGYGGAWLFVKNKFIFFSILIVALIIIGVGAFLLHRILKNLIFF